MERAALSQGQLEPAGGVQSGAAASLQFRRHRMRQGQAALDSLRFPTPTLPLHPQPAPQLTITQRERVWVNGRRILASKPVQLTGGTSWRLGTLPHQFTVSMSGSGAPTQVRASHLLVKHAGSRRPSSWKEEGVTRSEAEALAMVQQFRAQIAAAPDVPAAFAALAATESHCGSARTGGDLGFFGVSGWVPGGGRGRVVVEGCVGAARISVQATAALPAALSPCHVAP